MSSQDAEWLALEFFRRVWTPPHDLDAIDELMTEDYQITSGGQVIEGRERFSARYSMVQASAKFLRSSAANNSKQDD